MLVRFSYNNNNFLILEYLKLIVKKIECKSFLKLQVHEAGHSAHLDPVQNQVKLGAVLVDGQLQTLLRHISLVETSSH